MTPLYSGCYYHILNRGNARENLFRNDENYCYFIERLRRFVPPVADIVAWCLMPNHFHILVRIKRYVELRHSMPGRFDEPRAGLVSRSEIENEYDVDYDRQVSIQLSRQFSDLFNSYSRSFNKYHHRVGRLFEQPFKRNLIDSEDMVRYLVAYVHRNPIHHEFADSFLAWKYSSFMEIQNILDPLKSGLPASQELNWRPLVCAEVITNLFSDYSLWAHVHETSLEVLESRRMLLE